MTALDLFAARVRAAWGPLTSDLVGECRRQLEIFSQAAASEPLLVGLLASRPEREELCRDPDHGFVLMAHAEQAGLYRPPHDHGRSWVVYGLLEGEIEIRTFIRSEDVGGARLVQRDCTVLRAGQALAYLPGDIHDTRCLSQTALLLRLTERDLRVEDRVEGRVTRYAAPADGWTGGR